jgi:hypothetical protein
MGPSSQRRNRTPTSPLPLDPGHGRISCLTHREGRTAQEALVAQMLEEVGLSFREQWLLRISGEALVFDFQVENRVLVECTQSTHQNCSKAWTTLWRRTIYLDYKFRLAKDTGSFKTIALLEAPHCQEYKNRALTPKRITNLKYTDYVTTSIPQLGRLLIDLLSGNQLEAQPLTVQKELERWLGSHTKQNSK